LIVDGADATEQIEDAWRDPTRSPLTLANQGTIVLLSPSALSEPTQQFLSRSLATRQSPAGEAVPLDLALVVCVPTTVDVLAASGHLLADLADQLGDKAVPLPPLVARPEDLRAIIMERLARIGLSVRGHPIGVEPRALATLIEHAWPGNEMELNDVLTRAAALADGDVLSPADLDRIGFRAVAPPVRHTSRPPSLRPLA
jgi:DNA-binding NtrC family response regulator